MPTGVRVLIIDDHAPFREGIKSLLLGLDPDAQTRQAASVEEARQWQGDPFDLVFLDLHMPGEHGMDALAQIKRCFDDAAVVVMSGDDAPLTIQSAIHNGAAGFVPKSTDTSVATQALKLVLSQGIYLPPEAHANLPSTAPSTADLSPRQLGVLRCLLQGKPNKVIAREMGIAEATVKAHLWAVYQMLGVNSRAQAMYRAHELQLFGVLTPPDAPPTFS